MDRLTVKGSELSSRLDMEKTKEVTVLQGLVLRCSAESH